MRKARASSTSSLLTGRPRRDGSERAGRIREAELMALLTSGMYPARNPEQNLADLRAQIAANEKGREELLKMVEQFGLDVVRAYMQHVQDNAEESVRRVITRLKDGEFDYQARQRGTDSRSHQGRSGKPLRNDRFHRQLRSTGE